MAQSDDIGRQMDKLVERVMRRLQLRIYQSVTIAMPVDLGFARSRWEPTTSPPPLTKVDRPSNRGVAEADAAAVFAKNQAAALALSLSYRLGNGIKIYLHNPTSYLPFLNLGSSAQAGKRFIERAVLAALHTTQAELG